MKINIREQLNNIDRDTFCKYDLLNLYESVNRTTDEKKRIAKALFENAPVESIYGMLYEDYQKGDNTIELSDALDGAIILIVDDARKADIQAIADEFAKDHWDEEDDFYEGVDFTDTKQHIIVDKEKIKESVDKIAKNYRFISITNHPKTRKFKEDHSLDDKDIRNILKQLSIGDYSYSVRSQNDFRYGAMLHLFITGKVFDLGDGRSLEGIYLYIKIDDTDEGPICCVSIHETGKDGVHYYTEDNEPDIYMRGKIISKDDFDKSYEDAERFNGLSAEEEDDFLDNYGMDETFDPSTLTSTEHSAEIFYLGDRLNEFMPDEDVRYYEKIKRILKLKRLDDIIVFPDQGEYDPKWYYDEAPVEKSKTELDKKGTVKYTFDGIDVIVDPQTGHLYFKNEEEALIYLNMVDAINRGEVLDEGFLDNIKAGLKTIGDTAKGAADKAKSALTKDNIKNGAKKLGQSLWKGTKVVSKELVKGIANQFGLRSDKVEEKLNKLVNSFRERYKANKDIAVVGSDATGMKNNVDRLSVDESKSIFTTDMDHGKKQEALGKFISEYKTSNPKGFNEYDVYDGKIQKMVYLGEDDGTHYYVDDNKNVYQTTLDFRKGGTGKDYIKRLLDGAKEIAVKEVEEEDDYNIEDDEYSQDTSLHDSLSRKGNNGMKLLEGIDTDEYEVLKNKIEGVVRKRLEQLGYEESFFNGYFFLDVDDDPDNDDLVKVEIRGEWDYDDTWKFKDDVDRILQEFDPDSYLDHVTNTAMEAYIRKDTTEDIPDQDMVGRYADLINKTRDKNELRDVYHQILTDEEQGMIKVGTMRVLLDLVDKRFDELPHFNESLHEDFDEDITFSEWFDETAYREDEEFYPFDNYVKTFPEAEVLRKAKAEDILKNAHRFYDIYAVDSADREKAFQFASEVLGLDYDVFYDAWIDEEPIKEGMNESYYKGSFGDRETDRAVAYIKSKIKNSEYRDKAEWDDDSVYNDFISALTVGDRALLVSKDEDIPNHSRYKFSITGKGIDIDFYVLYGIFNKNNVGKTWYVLDRDNQFVQYESLNEEDSEKKEKKFTPVKRLSHL